MRLEIDEPEVSYTSGSQTARSWTEGWVRSQLFCTNCGNPRLSQFPANLPVADFFCPSCQEQFELKSQKGRFGKRVSDGAFRTMVARLAANDNPSLVLLRYNVPRRAVTDVCVVPRHFFVPEIIQKRTPLAPTARRAGWVGCNILIEQIPQSGKIFVVRDGLVLDKESVLAQWQRTLFLREESADARGWLVEVMKCVEQIGKREFELDDVYAFESQLGRLYPNNRHVRQKIRQQLQVLRDHGFLEFVSRGYYRLRSES